MGRVKVKLLFFAKSREIVGKKETDFEFDSCTTAQAVLGRLVEAYPELGCIVDSVVLSLNEEYLELNNQKLLLKSGDELAVIPPISGVYVISMSGEKCLEEKGPGDAMEPHSGIDFVDVVEEKLSVEDITAKVTSPTSGAIALFVGTTRNNFDGKKVVRLEYEAYMPMAKKKMLETCELLRSKWTVENIVMIHRIGVVPVCEASIVIAVSSPHRKESLEAVHFAIDHVKATVPVWKKEIYEDESSSWKQNKECKWSYSKPPDS